MSELQYLIYYSQHNFIWNTLSIPLSFLNYLAPIKMKMPISSSSFMSFTFQCPGKRLSILLNEKFWVAHYIWKIEGCNGNEWWNSSTTATLLHRGLLPWNSICCFCLHQNHVVPSPVSFTLPNFILVVEVDLSPEPWEHMFFFLCIIIGKFFFKSITRVKMKFFKRLIEM